MTQGFPICEPDTSSGSYPDADPSDTELTPAYDAMGIVGVVRVVVSSHLAESPVHLVVVADGEVVFEDVATELVLGEIGDECRTCDTVQTLFAFP